MEYRIEIAGADSLLLRFVCDDPLRATARVAACVDQLSQKLSGQLLDLVPAYNTLLVTYDLRRNDDGSIRRLIAEALADLPAHTSVSGGREIDLPVCYETDTGYATDLMLISEQLSLPVAEIIQRHSQPVYVAQAVGFAPGFAYLGELDPMLRLPRMATPRTRVPAGSVAIAEGHSAVYPQESPGGWWLIGRCPRRLFDPRRSPPCLLQVGDRVRFTPISAAEFDRLEELS